MKISLWMLTSDPCMIVKEAELATLGKKISYIKDHSFSTDQWVDKMLANHSTLRGVRFRIVLDDVRSDVARQLVRHKKGLVQPYMQSKRPDWTGEARPKEPYECLLIIDTDIEGWRNIAGQRLCKRAMEETQKAIKEIILDMQTTTIYPEFFKALADISVPNCVMQGGCPEEEKRYCGFYPYRKKTTIYDIRRFK